MASSKRWLKQCITWSHRESACINTPTPLCIPVLTEAPSTLSSMILFRKSEIPIGSKAVYGFNYTFCISVICRFNRQKLQKWFYFHFLKINIQVLPWLHCYWCYYVIRYCSSFVWLWQTVWFNDILFNGCCSRSDIIVGKVCNWSYTFFPFSA